MKLYPAHAIASLVPDSELNEDNILPEAFNPDVADVVSKAVKDNIEVRLKCPGMGVRST